MNESIRRKQLQIRDQMKKLEEKLSGSGKLITDERVLIVEMEPMALLSKLKEGELSAVEVLRSFQSKALELNKRINCITEFIPEAERWAEACDSIPAEERGPLHGLPVSIKESIDVQGMDTTSGLAKYLYNPVSSHAVVVNVLIKKGAVPFCKTNVPQTLLSMCCTNLIFGETKNPHDPTRTPGGSSGGEAALIAGGGSVVGIGSDLGGSVRGPSSFSGCVGLKPTSNRLSLEGHAPILGGRAGIHPSHGVLGRNVNIVIECMKALTDGDEMQELDSYIVPLRWDELTLHDNRKLTFGYFDSIDFFPTSPGMKRAVHEAKKALQKAGHEVIPFEITELNNILKEFFHIVTADSGKSLKKLMEREIVDPSVTYGFGSIMNSKLQKLVMKYSLQFTSPLSAELIQTDCSDSYILWKHLFKRDQIRNEITNSMKNKKIDLIISPAYAIPAPQKYIPAMIGPAFMYTATFNYLDFPSGTVPVTKESEADQQMLEDYPEEDHLHFIAKQATRGATGLPIGVLISGLPWEEELVCRGMMELQESLKGHTQKKDKPVSELGFRGMMELQESLKGHTQKKDKPASKVSK